MSAVTAGLILAAGAGSRFGAAPKQLADLHGRPLLQWAIDAQAGVDPELLDPIVVVLGAHAARVRAAVDLRRARAVVCEHWQDGQARSLRCGLHALAASAGDGEDRVRGPVLVTLGDAPLVSAGVVARFAAEARDGGAPVRAVYGGRPGHPVVLGGEQIERARQADGDHGARGLLRDARTIEVGHLCSGRDVDTPEDLEEVRDEAGTVV